MGIDLMQLKEISREGIKMIEEEPDEEVLLVTTIKN